MSSKKDILKANKVSGPEKYIVLHLVFMTFQYIVEYYITVGSSIALLIFRIMTLSSLIFPVTILLLNYKPKLNYYRTYFLFVFSFNILITFVYLLFGDGRHVSNIGIYFGMLTAFLITQVDLRVLNRAFKKIAFIGCLVLIYVFLFLKIDISIALLRGYAWTETFYYASFYWAVIPFVIISFLKKENMKISLAYWISSIILNLLFLKRAIIVDSILLLIIIMIIISFKKIGKFTFYLKIVIYMILAITVSFILFGDIVTNLFDAVLLRFQSTGQDIGTFDRFVESKNYFSNANIVEIILGRGYLGTHFGLGWESDALHVGWCNFIFKGGIVLLSIVVIPYIKMITLLFNVKKLPEKIQFSVLMMLIYAIKLIYTNMHSFVPEMVIFFYCLFNIMDYKNNKNNFS